MKNFREVEIGECFLITQYLNYTKIKDTGTTIVVGVGNNSGEKLGLIKWRGGWRKYVFETLQDLTFDSNCLKDITGVLDEMMKQHKEK